MRRHGDMVREDGSSAANELISTSGHTEPTSTPSHTSLQGELHGGVPAMKPSAVAASRSSVDEIEPMVCRGVLLDVAARGYRRATRWLRHNGGGSRWRRTRGWR